MKKHIFFLALIIIVLLGLTACNEDESSVIGAITVTERNAHADTISHFDVRITNETRVDSGFGMHDDYGGYIIDFELENISGQVVIVDIVAVFPGEHGGRSEWLIDQNIQFEPGQTRQFTHTFGEYNYIANLIIEYWLSQESIVVYPDVYLFHESVDMGIYFTIHPAWHLKFGVEELTAVHDTGTIQTLVLYHIATRDEFGMGESGGMLFWINRSPDALFEEVLEGFAGIILEQNAGYTYTLNYPRGFEHLYDPDSATTIQYLNMMGYLQPWDNNFVTNSFRLTGTNLFADALLDFFEGGVDVPDGIDATKSFIHSIDETTVMVAIRHEVRAEETGHDLPIPVARIFYLVDNALNYKDIETYQDRPPLTVLSGGLALSGGHWTDQWIALLGLENGQLVRTLTLFTAHDEDDYAKENPRYYVLHGHYLGLDGRTSITQEEFDVILNTREFARWEDMFDITDYILTGVPIGATGASPELPFTTTDNEWPPLQLDILLTPDNIVLIETNRPLFDFAWIELDHDFVDDEFVFLPGDIRTGTISELLPGEPFVIDNFMDNGIMPTNAITFLDQYSERRYFAFQLDNSLDLDPSPNAPNFLDNVINGQVQIYATTGSGARTDLGYFDVYIDNFDPDVWGMTNSYRWAAHVMLLWELHNIG